MKATSKAPWRCPKCGREFAQKLAFHSCGNYTIEGYLQGKNPAAIALFQTLVELCHARGPVVVSAVKTQITFRLRTTFMMVFVSGKRIGGFLFLPRASPAPCFRRVTTASANRHVHHFQISDPHILNGEFANYLTEAIAFASDKGEEEPVAAKEKGAASIGDEINALYRAERAQSQLRSP